MSQVLVGRIGRPHGVGGEVLLDSLSLSPSELLAVGRFQWRGRRGETRTLALTAVRPANDRLLAHFEGVVGRDAAAELTLGELWADEGVLPDPGPGTAYTFQLVGMAVRTVDGRALGTLAAIWPTGANPVYVVQGEKELLLPGIPDVIRHVDMEARVITVAPPVGIEDL